MAMERKEAIELTKQLLLDQWPNRPDQAEVDIYDWSTNDLRIAEVSFSYKPKVGILAGWSWMQSDWEAGAQVFAVERAILEAETGDNRDDLIDAQWRMLAACFSDTIAHEWASKL